MATYNVYLNATRPAAYPTYYVDATLGDDDDAGTIDAPWQTIAKVNAASLDPGDSVLFKRGETFAGKLEPVLSGAAGQYITYGAYGTGNRPIIDGTVACALFIYDDYHHLRYESIDFSDSKTLYCVVYCTDAHDVYFYDCIVRDSLDQPGMLIESYAHVAYNITVDSCTFHSNYLSGLIAASVTSHDILIKDSTAYENGSNIYADHGFYIGGGATCDNCVSYDNLSGGFKLNDNENASSYYPLVKNSISYGNYYGFIMTHKNAEINNNLAYSNDVNLLFYGNEWGGYKVYFNTFVNGTSGSEQGIRFEAGVSANSLIKNNLFIQDDAAAGVSSRCLGTHASTTAQLLGAYTFDYNVYYFQGSADENVCNIAGDAPNNLKTWAEWTGDGAEPHGTHLTDLPGFVTRYSDLHPANGGNLKALGLAIAGYEDDKSGVERAATPTPGCYETTV